MCVATATIIGVSVAGAQIASSQIAAKKQRDAAKEAAKTQTDSASEARTFQQQQYEQSRQDFDPYKQAGAGALGRLGQSASQQRPEFRPGQPQPSFQMPQAQTTAAPGALGAFGMAPQGGQGQMAPQGQQGGQMVQMKGPDGSIRPVRSDLVQQFIAKGAQVVQ